MGLSRIGTALFALNGGFDMFPKVIRRLNSREQLPRSFGNGLEIGQQGAAKLAILDVWVCLGIRSRTDQLRQLGLKLGAGHLAGIAGHGCASFLASVRKVSRSLRRALCSCD